MATMTITFDLKHLKAARRALSAEARKVAHELIKARDDYDAAVRFHEIDNSELSTRMVDRSAELVSDLTDECLALHRLALQFSHRNWIKEAVDAHGHCSQ